jgi:hypothetical protein
VPAHVTGLTEVGAILDGEAAAHMSFPLESGGSIP